MSITLIQLLIWIVIAAIVGIAGELIAGRRGPHGFIGATLLGWLAIFLIVGVFHFHIIGEPVWQGVPILSSVIAAVLLAALYSIVFRRQAVTR
ncbi:MAG TPA: transglycosylase [Ktedonobacterales bacterium]|nr:transglycosylase [Ktedonobacterales bacterium]